MELLAYTRIVMWEGGSLWLVNATPVTSIEPRRTDFHSHHAIQLTICLGGVFKLATAEGSLEGDTAAVAADTSHVFEAEGLFALLFVEPESRAGRAVAASLFGQSNLAVVPEAALHDFRVGALAYHSTGRRDDDALIELGRGLVASLAAGSKAHAPDLRIRKAIGWAAQQLDKQISLGEAATVAGLSSSRLRHLFVEQTGLPFKTYVLWLRLTRALESFAVGASLTEAAHAAGFADSAHLSRTFRRMFGVAPTALRMT